MITVHNNKGLIYYQFETVYYCFLAFSLAELLNNIPTELKQICLTKLN